MYEKSNESFADLKKIFEQWQLPGCCSALSSSRLASISYTLLQILEMVRTLYKIVNPVFKLYEFYYLFAVFVNFYS